MEITYEQLKHKNVQELRAMAAELNHPAVEGHTQMNKEHLVPALCTALGIDAHEHHVAKGLDKSKVKSRIRTLKGARESALGARDRKQLKRVRRRIHRLKHRLRSAAV